MGERKYYSVRTGKRPDLVTYDLDLLRRLFYNSYSDLKGKGYFQEAFGYYCEDAGEVTGTVGSDIELYFFRKLRKPDLWPIFQYWSGYTEDDIFDVIELLYDNVSKPVDGSYHSWNDCGWHYHSFDKDEGKAEYRKEVNDFLKDYNDSYVLSEKGEILLAGPTGLRHIFNAKVPQYDPDNIDNRVETAVTKFRSHRSNFSDRKNAVRDLADVLEYLRPKLKDILMTKDEQDLFNIANNFAIRHHNSNQKSDYDPIWLSWIFYIYLSTIHLSLRLLDKEEKLKCKDA